MLRHYDFADFQAEEIAKILSVNYKLPIRHGMIQRCKTTEPQVQMKNREERMKNMKGVFVISIDLNIPKNILLVDDVFTIGATMREACSVMKRGVAEFVWGITLAR